MFCMKKLKECVKTKLYKSNNKNGRWSHFFQMMNNVAILKDTYKIMSMYLLEEK